MKVVVSIILAGVIIAGAMFLTSSGGSSKEDGVIEGSNVSVAGEKQIVKINAKGGYSPKSTNAKAGVSTTLKVNTQGTFDCSSALTIPSIGYNKFLPPTGITEIDIPPQESGTTLYGQCSMGMYSFQIRFE